MNFNFLLKDFDFSFLRKTAIAARLHFKLMRRILSPIRRIKLVIMIRKCIKRINGLKGGSVVAKHPPIPDRRAFTGVNTRLWLFFNNTFKGELGGRRENSFQTLQ